MGIQYTALGVVITLLWVLADSWEWSIPETLEEQLREWKRKWGDGQAEVSLPIKDSLINQEQFLSSIKSMLPRLERELGNPVHIAIDVSGDNRVLTEEEIRFLDCFLRSHSEYTWRFSGQAEFQAE